MHGNNACKCISHNDNPVEGDAMFDGMNYLFEAVFKSNMLILTLYRNKWKPRGLSRQSRFITKCIGCS